MNPFYKLAPFIQDYIWSHHWNELRDVQVQAIDALLESQEHVLIASGTASGKTEAAFFPMLSKLSEEPVNSFGILYIGPLKALINDQFERITELLEEADFPIYAWHGDRSQAEKSKAKHKPKGVLQITPEALEGLLMNNAGDAANMFNELQFIIIDEIHAFMGTDRGIQLQCQLVRLNRLVRRDIRRVGLSATINDYGSAKSWLCAGSERGCSLVESHAGGRQLNLYMQHYIIDRNDDHSEEEVKKSEIEYLYQQSKGQKCLIFTNSRTETENVVSMLREQAEERKEPDVFFAHHGTISASLREEAEHALREAEKPAVAVATRTLELGIDLGSLDKVIQIGSPSTCSSFVQRLGRTGRRDSVAKMRFLTTEYKKGNLDFNNVPWDLIQNIAIIQLYLESRWVEPFFNKPCPYSVLFHQILSALMQAELSPRELAKKVYTLPAFASITQEDYISIVKYMLSADVIEKTESGTLIPGLTGEKIAGNYRFLSVFPTQEGYRVKHLQKEIGELFNLPDINEIILLAGKKWKVTDIDKERKTIYVVPSKGKAGSVWIGEAIDVADEVVQRMQKVLLEDDVYAYVSDSAKEALSETRALAEKYNFNRQYSSLCDNRLLIHPWLGTKKIKTLYFLLKNVFCNELKIQDINKVNRLFLDVETQLQTDVFWTELLELLKTLPPERVEPMVEPYYIDKYDAYIPKDLLCKAYINNCMDISGLKECLHLP